MSLDALILSLDPDVINVFRNVMEDAGINIHESIAVEDSLNRLASQRYDAIIVDCEGVPDSTGVIESLRKGKSNKTSIAFAVVGQDAKVIKSVLDQGATFVLHKPISTDTVLRSMRASHGLIVRERRKYLRYAVETHAHLQVGKHEEMQVAVSDISEGGCAVSIPFKESLSGEGTIRLMLPDVKEMLEGKIEVMWCQASGQAGIRFVQLSRRSEQFLLEWLNVRAEIAGFARHFKMAKRRTNH